MPPPPSLTPARKPGGCGPALGFELLRGLSDISLAQLGQHLVQAWQGEVVSGELTFLQTAELLWAG